ncbi:aldo/keto reductase [Kibdelosporangium aridum]|uniref:aldo/keto reductase n=1 Tax=Kibdelosporangium aridum TaxID=2030 RepID=UPI0035EBA4B0
MSHGYGATDDTQSIATLQRALDLEVTFLDTADFYGSGHNVVLIPVLGGRSTSRRTSARSPLNCLQRTSRPSRSSPRPNGSPVTVTTPPASPSSTADHHIRSASRS